jgi:hypothetical protein
MATKYSFQLEASDPKVATYISKFCKLQRLDPPKKEFPIEEAEAELRKIDALRKGLLESQVPMRQACLSVLAGWSLALSNAVADPAKYSEKFVNGVYQDQVREA